MVFEDAFDCDTWALDVIVDVDACDRVVDETVSVGEDVVC